MSLIMPPCQSMSRQDPQTSVSYKSLQAPGLSLCYGEDAGIFAKVLSKTCAVTAYRLGQIVGLHW